MRRSLKYALTQRVPLRDDTGGLYRRHIDYGITTALTRKQPEPIRKALEPILLWLGGPPTKQRIGDIQTITTGGVYDGTRLSHFSTLYEGSARCPRCKMADETHLHIWAKCPCWERIRAFAPRVEELWREDDRIITKACAVALELPEIGIFRQRLYAMQLIIPPPPTGVLNSESSSSRTLRPL